MFQVFRRFWQRRRRVSTLNVKLQAASFFLLLLWYATSGFLYFELPGKPDLGWLDALWWAVVTMATVGYGDLFPVSTAGRYLVGVPTMIFGIGFLGYLISEIAGGLIESRARRLRGMADIKARQHILIVNFPRLDGVLRILRELGADTRSAHQEVCLIDEHLEELPPELVAAGVHFVKGDPTRAEVLKRACVAQATQALVLVRNPSDPHCDDQNLVCTLVLERLHPGLFTVVEVANPEKIRQMEMAGADSVICATEITAGLMVQELQDPGIRRIIHDLTSDDGGHQIYFVPLADGDRTYRDLVNSGLDRGCTVIGLLREGQDLLNCSPAEPIQAGDRAMVIGAARPQSL